MMQSGKINSSAPTNIMFTKAGLQNAEVSVGAGGNFRIAIRGTEVGNYIDLANTTLNFNLNIPILVASTINGWVPNYSVSDIFSVSSVSLDGVQLSLSKQEEQDQLLRKILYYCDGRDNDMRDGRSSNEEDVIEMRQVDNTKAFLGAVLTGISEIERNPVRFIYSAENRRKTRLFNRLYTVTGQVLSARTADHPLTAFSVKLSDLCPQLANLTTVDCAKLFQGQGLQINIRLLPASQCMSGYLLEADVADNTLCDLFAQASYTIDDVHLGVIQHQIPDQIMAQPVSFMTYQGLNYAFSNGATTFNQNFSLPVNDAFVRGFCVMFTPTGGRVIGGASAGSVGTTSKIPTKANWHDDQASFQTGQISYTQYKGIDNTQINVNGVQYPRSGAVVPKSCVQLQQALYSQEIFGHSYAPSWQRYHTIDHCLFYPVNTRIKGGVSIQFYQSYLQAMTNMTIQILVICDRVLSYEGGQVMVE